MFNAEILFAGVGMGGFLCPPSFGVSLLTICSVRLASGPPSGPPTPEDRQILKKYSGIPMMYFKLKSHRSTILIGSAVIANKRNVSM